MANKMALERKIDALAETLGVVATQVNALDGKFDALDQSVTSLDQKVSTLGGEVGSLRGEIGSLKGAVGGLDGRLGTLEAETKTLANNMKVGFEDTHRLIKLSLEGLAGVSETTEAKFHEMADDHAKQIDLLQKVSVHIRRRVEKVEQTARRRR